MGRLVQIPGGHHGYRELHGFGGLESHPEVEPAACALADFAGRQNQDEKYQASCKSPRRPAPQEVRWKLRHDKHCDDSDAEAHKLIDQQTHVFADCAVQNDQAECTYQ